MFNCDEYYDKRKIFINNKNVTYEAVIKII